MNDKLLNEFPPITTQEWENIINKDLKGADYEKKLIWKTLEGFNVKPYYRAENLENLDYLTKELPNNFPFLRANSEINDWKIRQDIIVNSINVKEINLYAKKIIENGINSIGFVFETEISENDFYLLLNGIDITKIEINLISYNVSEKYLQYLISYVEKNNIDKDKIFGSNEYDPLGYLLVNGVNPCENEICKCTNKQYLEYHKLLPNFKIIIVNARNFNNAGGTIVEELAFALSQAAEYLDIISDLGLKIDEIATMIRFNFAVASNYFMEIAKLRAARYLWAKIVEAYNPENKNITKINIHSETSHWNKTIYDPYVNMLRVTTEAMSAILGSTNSLTVLPFNVSFEKNTEFSSRIAKNVQLIIKEEAHFGKIIDPAAGSYYLENLTNELIEKAWNLFLQVQDNGGFKKSLFNEFIQNKIEATSKLRDKNIEFRKEILLGTNQYPNFKEIIKNNVIVNKNTISKVKQTLVKPIKIYRASEKFETLRLEVDKLEKRPVAFMLTIGNLAMRKARSQFACNFFACAGIEVIDNNGFDSISEGYREAMNKKADIIVLCSSDEEYEEFAYELQSLILTEENKNTIITIAGNPECKDKLSAKGINNFIHVKSNLLEELNKYISRIIN